MKYLSSVMAIARVTFGEIARDKVLYSSGVVSLILMAISFFASKLTYAQPERITLDFGLAAVSIVTLVIGVLIGSTMIGREFERRTIFVALSKPISRLQYLIGKTVGLFGILTANWLILTLIFLALLKYVGGQFTGVLAWALVLSLMQGFLATAIAVCISSYSTAALSIMVTLGIYFAGSNVSEMKYLAAKFEGASYTAILPYIASVWPNFESFQLGTRVTYMLPLPASMGFSALAYGFVMTVAFILFAGVLIHHREH